MSKSENKYCCDETCTNTTVATLTKKAITMVIGVALAGLGLIGIANHVEYSGWLIFVGLMAVWLEL